MRRRVPASRSPRHPSLIHPPARLLIHLFTDIHRTPPSEPALGPGTGRAGHRPGVPATSLSLNSPARVEFSLPIAPFLSFSFCLSRFPSFFFFQNRGRPVHNGQRQACLLRLSQAPGHAINNPLADLSLKLRTAGASDRPREAPPPRLATGGILGSQAGGSWRLGWGFSCDRPAGDMLQPEPDAAAGGELQSEDGGVSQAGAAGILGASGVGGRDAAGVGSRQRHPTGQCRRSA